jgi:hypothetical protein
MSTKADDMKAAKKMEPSDDISGRVIDFQRRATESLSRREKQRLLEQMRGMTTSEKQVFLLGMIMNEETLGRIWGNFLDALACEFEE